MDQEIIKQLDLLKNELNKIELLQVNMVLNFSYLRQLILNFEPNKKIKSTWGDLVDIIYNVMPYNPNIDFSKIKEMIKNISKKLNEFIYEAKE